MLLCAISNDALTSSLLGGNYMRVNPTLPEEWAAVETWVKSKFLGDS